MSISERWPDGGVAYMQQSKSSAQYMTIEASPPDADGFSSICYGTFDANNRGLPPGTIKLRHAAELESLREENQQLRERLKVREFVCLDFADNPRDITTMQAPADTIDEVRSALRGTAAMYRDAIAELDLLKSQSEDERKITGILLAHLGLDESAAFTEAGVPNLGRLRSILAYENKS